MRFGGGGQREVDRREANRERQDTGAIDKRCKSCGIKGMNRGGEV